MNDFYKEILKSIDKNTARLAPATYSTYVAHVRKLQKFEPKVLCSDVDEKFVLRYVDFMRTCGNREGTIYRSLSILRMFMNMLRRERVIRYNPMEKVPLRRVRSQREFLEVNELASLYRNFLENSREIPPGEREALRAFLFSCFTGLRYSDLRNLSPRDFQNGKIRMFTHKTGMQVYIPVPSQALALLPGRPSDTILHVIDNSTFNKRLRSGAKKLGCNRHLHAHLARHTFATSCISFGMPLEVVSKLLGHSSLQTTLIYANYSTAVIDREMQKFVL